MDAELLRLATAVAEEYPDNATEMADLIEYLATQPKHYWHATRITSKHGTGVKHSSSICGLSVVLLDNGNFMDFFEDPDA